MLNNIINPDLYHGKNKGNKFFEGWYFKLVHPHQNYVLCFIAGITLSGKPHSFIQVLEGHDANFKYLKYEPEAFTFNPKSFNIKILNNSFSLDGLSIDLICETKHIKGNLKFHNTKKWPDSLINPGSMGFYNYLTFMQCYSQVCSMDSYISGSIDINGKTIDFTGGRAYIEKNWGKDFPYSYVWAQCNNFNMRDASLTCSIAHIPFPISSFTGFLIGLYIGDTFYKFTSINGSKLILNSSRNKITLTACNKKHILKFICHASPYSFMNLYAPRGEEMIPIARESLQAELDFHILDAVSKEVLYSSRGHCAGLEFGGNYQTLSRKL